MKKFGPNGNGLDILEDEPLLAAAFYQAFRRSNDVMLYCDAAGVIRDVNEAFTRHYGYSRDEAVGKTPRILRSKRSSKELYRRMWAAILDPDKRYWRGHLINRAKDGREVPMILTISAVEGADGKTIGYISNGVDLTEQTALQARVAQSESLANIGEMTAVVAHEIRNPLGSVVMASKQLVSGELGEDDRSAVLKVLRAESERLDTALNNFLSFARPRDIRLAPTDLNALVSEVCGLVDSNKEIAGHIRLRLVLDKGLQPLPLDSEQIRQALWNLITNALQAMAGSGTLTVTTGRRGREACFCVEDTGPGIPEAHLQAIFKPFHTTKPKGTGLGLAITDRIVKAHGGRIEAKSRLDEGTRFEVHIPSVET